MRVLHIEDDAACARTVELVLKSQGFNVYTTDLGDEGVDLARTYDYDLILLDMDLPDMTGLDALRQMRSGEVKAPVMFLSDAVDMPTKLRAFGLGADDYLTKPFHSDELVARSHALVRRGKGHAQSTISAGPITVNLDTKICSVDGKPVRLTRKEYGLVELLALRLEQTVTKEAVMNHLYGGMDEPELKIVDVFICKLRKKLSEAAGGANHIETVWGTGYRLVAEPVKPRFPAGTNRAFDCRTRTLSDRIMDLLRAETHGLAPRDMPGLLNADKNQVTGALKSLRERNAVERRGTLPNIVYFAAPDAA